MDEPEVVGGRYEIVRPLGKGGMGEVVLARQRNLDRLVVIKRVLDRSMPHQVSALLSEARVAAQLHHPNIISILDVSAPDETPYVAFELVVGVTLNEMLDAAPDGLPVEVALPVALDLLRGLAYAHSLHGGRNLGLVHRDVKPRNVMVTFAGSSKLIDFGISRWLGDELPDTIAGTHGYMPPEQQRGDRLDGRADQYALGVTLREMLGRNADAPLAAIVARATAPQAADRFADCDAMTAALEAYAADHALALSLTRVARWVCSELAERRIALQRELFVRRKPPTAPTTQEPAFAPRMTILFTVANRGERTDGWLGAVIDRLLRARLRTSATRRFALSRTEHTGALAIDVEYVRTDGQLRIDVQHRAASTTIASVTGTSVTAAIDELATALTRQLGGSTRVIPDDDESTAMRRLRARSVEAYRGYCRTLEEFLIGTAASDSEKLASRVDELLTLDPDWLHLHALGAILRGTSTQTAREMIALARSRTSSDDARGRALIDAIELCALGEHERACDLTADLFRTDDHDLLVGSQYLMECIITQRSDDAAAAVRRLDELEPGLEFGSDVAMLLRRSGHHDEAEAAIRHTIARAPENATAVLELVRIEAESGRASEATQLARDMLFVQGDGDNAALVFDAFILCGDYATARRIADRMLVGSRVMRARGRYRVGVAAVFDGRFSAAYDSLRRAATELRPLAWEGELSQCLELLRTIAVLVGDRVAQRRYLAELVDTFANLVADPVATADASYELALLDGSPPSLDEHLSKYDDGPVRDAARRRVLRRAAVAGFVPHADAVAAGFSPDEENPGSLVAFAQCARCCGELDLAKQSLETATRLWGSRYSNQASPYAAILARYHLAGVRGDLGDATAARAEYERFLRCWGNADRPIPEVAAARRAMRDG